MSWKMLRMEEIQNKELYCTYVRSFMFNAWDIESEP
jgi:hypothetical protein